MLGEVIIMRFLFISGLIVFAFSTIAIEKQYFGFGFFLFGFSCFLFINSLISYLFSKIELKPKELTIRTNNNNKEHINWISVSEQLPTMGTYLLLFDGDFVCYGYYSYVNNCFSVIDYKDHKQIIKWAEIPCGGLK